MSGNRPIDHMIRAGMYSSLGFGVGGLAYTSLRGIPLSTIRRPLKYCIMSSTTFGGAACGAVCGGIVAVCLVGIGAAGQSSDESNVLLLKYSAVLGGIGASVGGIAGLGFGAISNKLTYTLAEAISHNVPRRLLAPTTTAIVLLSFYSLARIFFQYKSSPSH
jgi:hypothetical protein